MASRYLKMIDIGANMTDPVYSGIYHGKPAHPKDYLDVLGRAFDIGVEKIIVTGGSLSDSKKALELARNGNEIFCTVGCHPTRCSEFESTLNVTPCEYLEQLYQIASENVRNVVAIGEIGLDYDRLQYCDKDLQQLYFEKQFEISEKTGLPLFLHCRNAFKDFFGIVERNRRKFKSGVVHSFTGTKEEAMGILEHDLYIGINGCSMKTSDNLDVIKNIPPDRILIETDSPWCEIRPSHASYKMINTQFPVRKKERWEQDISVKSRNEPRNLIQVLEVLCSIYQIDKFELSELLYQNTCSLFKFAV